MVIDVRGPGGNVYAVLGIAKGAARDIRRMGDPELADKIEAILGRARSMKYDAILDALVECAPGIFEFTGRHPQGGVEDEEDE